MIEHFVLPGFYVQSKEADAEYLDPGNTASLNVSFIDILGQYRWHPNKHRQVLPLIELNCTIYSDTTPTLDKLAQPSVPASTAEFKQDILLAAAMSGATDIYWRNLPEALSINWYENSQPVCGTYLTALFSLTRKRLP